MGASERGGGENGATLPGYTPTTCYIVPRLCFFSTLGFRVVVNKQSSHFFKLPKYPCLLTGRWEADRHIWLEFRPALLLHSGQSNVPSLLYTQKRIFLHSRTLPITETKYIFFWTLDRPPCRRRAAGTFVWQPRGSSCWSPASTWRWSTARPRPPPSTRTLPLLRQEQPRRQRRHWVPSSFRQNFRRMSCKVLATGSGSIKHLKDLLRLR